MLAGNISVIFILVARKYGLVLEDVENIHYFSEKCLEVTYNKLYIFR